tara:strand:+ start:807 stop:1262 length:456 start_codon:yes stop_codon:yes gene_type:complete
MAHFAKISEENEVLQVVTFADKDMKDAEGTAVESIGQTYLETHHSWPANLWIQTSYRTSHNTHSTGDNSKAFRGNYAGIGYMWDSENQIFWRPKPYASWVKNTTIAEWDSPLGQPPSLTPEQTSQNEAGTHGWIQDWNEDNQAWDLTNTLA